MDWLATFCRKMGNGLISERKGNTCSVVVDWLNPGRKDKGFGGSREMCDRVSEWPIFARMRDVVGLVPRGERDK